MESTASRRFIKTLHKAGNLAAATVATWQAQFKGRVTEVEVALGAAGSTSGQTSVDVRKNGTSILTAVVSIAQGSATLTARSSSLVFGAAGGGEPGGVDFVEGDLFTVVITAVPGTTSADLTVDLACIAKGS